MNKEFSLLLSDFGLSLTFVSRPEALQGCDVGLISMWLVSSAQDKQEGSASQIPSFAKYFSMGFFPQKDL